MIVDHWESGKQDYKNTIQTFECLTLPTTTPGVNLNQYSDSGDVNTLSQLTNARYLNSISNQWAPNVTTSQTYHEDIVSERDILMILRSSLL